MLRAAIAATSAFFVVSSVESRSGESGVGLEGCVSVRSAAREESFGLLWIGRPKPAAKVLGLRRPAMPKGRSSRVAMTRARHSAGGGRRWRMLRFGVVIL